MIKSSWPILIFSLAFGTFGCSNKTIRSSEPELNQMNADAETDLNENDIDVDTGIDTDREGASDTGVTQADMNVDDVSSVYPAPAYGLTQATVMHGGQNRTYLTYIPESYSVSRAAPVLFNFHGNGDTAEIHLNIANLRPIADTEGLILVYPQGSLLEGEETHWNPLLNSELNKSNTDDLGFVSLMIDMLAEQLNIDDQRIYATGYSNGAGMVYGLACYLSDRIAAVAPVSGSMYIESRRNCNASHPTSIAIFNGTQDFTRPYDGYTGFLLPVEEAVSFWLSHNNISGSPATDSFSTRGLTVERSVYTGGEGGSSVALYKVIGGDHVWFDIEIEGADLNMMIWQFLSAQDLSGGRQPD